MSMPFDATLKDLVQTYLHDYEMQIGLEEFEPLTPLNVDLSTVTAATDVALGQGNPPNRVVDLNFQSGAAADLAARGLLYNALLHHRFGVPIHSVVILLRPGADHNLLTGKLRYQGRKRKGRMDFAYEVVRMWQQPVRRFLTGGLGTLPLAPLCRLPAGITMQQALGPIVRRIAERLEHEAAPEDRAKLLSAAYVLTGLRVARDVAEQIFQGVRAMKESSTYQAILEEGQAEALQKTLLRQGRKRFGNPSDAVQAAIHAQADIGRLERMTESLLVVSTWQELLDTP
jgi:predicted transposase YdaD